MKRFSAVLVWAVLGGSTASAQEYDYLRNARFPGKVIDRLIHFRLTANPKVNVSKHGISESECRRIQRSTPVLRITHSIDPFKRVALGKRAAHRNLRFLERRWWRRGNVTQISDRRDREDIRLGIALTGGFRIAGGYE